MKTNLKLNYEISATNSTNTGWTAEAEQTRLKQNTINYTNQNI